MTKWCQDCGQKLVDAGTLFACPSCRGPLADHPKGTNLTPDQEAEVRRIVAEVVGDSKFTPAQTTQMKLTILEVIGVKLTIFGIIGLIGYVIALISGVLSVRRAVITRVDAEFQTPRIQTVVAEAAAKQGTNLLQGAVQPEIARFKAEVKDSLANAKKQTEDELDGLQFIAVEYAAKSIDDGKSYDHLLAWSRNIGGPLFYRALEVLNDLEDEWIMYPKTDYGGWGQTPIPQTMIEARQNYAGVDKSSRGRAVYFFWQQPHYAKLEKVRFLIDVMEFDKSIWARRVAGKLLREEANVPADIRMPDYSRDWLKTNEHKFMLPKQ